MKPFKKFLINMRRGAMRWSWVLALHKKFGSAIDGDGGDDGDGEEP